MEHFREIGFGEIRAEINDSFLTNFKSNFKLFFGKNGRFG